MLAYHNPSFEYPGAGGSIGYCEVSLYWDLQGVCLVLILDHDDHGSTSVTNAIETVCGLVQTRVLNTNFPPAGKVNTRWVAWSAVDGIYSKVTFADPLYIRSPRFSFIAQNRLLQLCLQFGIDPLNQVPI